MSIFSGIELQPFGVNIFLSLLAIVFLLMSSAFVSASEVAYFSLTSAELEEMDNDNVRQLLQNPNELLATILITNNFINVAIVVISTYLTSIAIWFPEGSSLEFVFQVVIITGLLLLFGEIMPKVYANNNAVAFSLRTNKVLISLKKAVYPLSYLLLASTNFINKKLVSKQTPISIEEISKALDIIDHENKEEEKRILRSIVEFGNTDVKEIMKSRVAISAIDKKTSFTQVLKIIISSGYSRIPVFEKRIDKIVGILYIKDLIPYLNEKNDFDWVKLCRAPYFIPETKMLNDLLKEFQAKKNHLAIVVDEYGGTSGLVTLEDVLEEIVGEINDEFDVDDNVYSKLDEHNYIFEGKISLNDFLKITKAEIDFFDKIKGEYDTLAGLVLELEGNIPKIGTVYKITPFTIVVESADLRKIKRLKVTIDEN
ncbi:MAG: gliding motility-associated protein GldE [Bacteroidetes bacterium]|nr:gliding motility-associated protein GldE [Bacteroidota bacterium]